MMPSSPTASPRSSTAKSFVWSASLLNSSSVSEPTSQSRFVPTRSGRLELRQTDAQRLVRHLHHRQNVLLRP